MQILYPELRKSLIKEFDEVSGSDEISAITIDTFDLKKDSIHNEKCPTLGKSFFNMTSSILLKITSNIVQPFLFFTAAAIMGSQARSLQEMGEPSGKSYENNI